MKKKKTWSRNFDTYYELERHLKSFPYTTRIFCDASQTNEITSIACFDMMRHKEFGKIIPTCQIMDAEIKAIEYAVDYVLTNQVRNAIILSEMKDFVQFHYWICCVGDYEQVPKQYRRYPRLYSSLCKKLEFAYVRNDCMLSYIYHKDNLAHSAAYRLTHGQSLQDHEKQKKHWLAIIHSWFE